MNENIRNFVEEFFKSIKAEIKTNEDRIIISNIPKPFEDFYGKKGPYVLVFSKTLSERIPEAELITKGNYLLSAISSYLEDKGQATLLKLNFKVNTDDIKGYLKLRNCEINKTILGEKNEYLVRFTFITNFQYLNEREQLINSVYATKDKIFIFDLTKYDYCEGEKRSLQMPDLKIDYEKAKEEIKNIVKPKVLDLSIKLREKLKKEVERIKNHYESQIKEIDEKMLNFEKQINDLETGNTQGDLKNIPIRINKLKEMIEELKKSNKKEELEKEMKFFLNDEINKHSLSINNKLINTTIIYYPLYEFSLFLKNSEINKQISLTYNPLEKDITKLICDSCKGETKEINLCSSGHITCFNCSARCTECGKDFCKICLQKSCELCGKKICQKCIKRCSKCGKGVCKSHIQNYLGKEVCVNCLRYCVKCKTYNERLVKCPTCFREICENCARTDFIKFNGKILCSACSTKCLACGNSYDKSLFQRCAGCNLRYCNYSGKCLNCRRQLCGKLRR